ncbi:MAG: signal recognition particle-docking protein FtsY, partial [Planctomycetaceae bacterium]|nr:signal recognition particle-docking protein FtsY [Planctomycetaceae bacterium]
MGLFDKLKRGLQKTKQLLQTDVRDLLKEGEILTEEQLERFEARLIQTDMGVEATDRIVADLRKEHLGRTLVIDELWKTVNQTLRSILKDNDATVWDPNRPLSPIAFANEGPTVILVSGVNGVGKTTSIAKLAKLLTDQGKSVVLAA